ncbi:uncharacterized protein P884DRAFT_25113 [Thermothelomyces heterothallicus CBS 202.75]|uniref:uncharacterized protein n=1 Tax=Thermothelomyces heterothallicus CBS 202.75 TaxID=1149848 RepID=UPI0037420FA9
MLPFSDVKLELSLQRAYAQPSILPPIDTTNKQPTDIFFWVTPPLLPFMLTDPKRIKRRSDQPFKSQRIEEWSAAPR